MAAAYKGARISANEASVFVNNYFELKTLAELGYRYDMNELEVFEAEAYSIIKGEINRLELKDAKKRR